jgi:hypothetical protein
MLLGGISDLCKGSWPTFLTCQGLVRHSQGWEGLQGGALSAAEPGGDPLVRHLSEKPCPEAQGTCYRYSERAPHTRQGPG